MNRFPMMAASSCWLALISLTLLGCDADQNQRGGWIDEATPVAGDEPLEPIAPPERPAGLVSATLTEEGELPSAMATDARYVYWTTRGGSMYRVAKSGGTPQLLAEDARIPTDLMVVDGSVYWGVQGEDGDGALLKVSVSGGAVSTVATGDVTHVAYDDMCLFWITRDFESGALTVTSMPRRGGYTNALLTLTPAEHEQIEVAVGPDALYWLRSQAYGDDPGITVHRSLKALVNQQLVAEPEELIATSPRSGIIRGSLQVEGDQVVWQDRGWSLQRVAVEGGEIADIDGRESIRTFAPVVDGVLAVRLYEPGIRRYDHDGASEMLYETATDTALLVVEDGELTWAEWSTECTEERFEGKSAWCAAYRYEVQLVRAPR